MPFLFVELTENGKSKLSTVFGPHTDWDIALYAIQYLLSLVFMKRG